MAAVSAAIAGIGALGGLAQTISGAQQASAAKSALSSLKAPTLTNPYENQQVSTLGADLQKQEAARTSASDIEALQGAGTRGVVGGVGRVQAQNQQMNQGIAANLDQQQAEINKAKAGQEVANQNTMEGRYQNQAAALSSQYNAGNQSMWQGLQGMASSATSAANAYVHENAGTPGTTPPGITPPVTSAIGDQTAQNAQIAGNASRALGGGSNLNWSPSALPQLGQLQQPQPLPQYTNYITNK